MNIKHTFVCHAIADVSQNVNRQKLKEKNDKNSHVHCAYSEHHKDLTSSCQVIRE